MEECQVTVVEYVDEFFKQYGSRQYGRSLQANATRGAETLFGMLKLVLSRGGRDELRIALHCFKDQLVAAVSSPPSVRSQHVDEVFALLSALIDAAERLRQFSPVKQELSSVVLEELRYRLFRIIAGERFSEDLELRRRALNLVFAGLMRETAEVQQSRVRQCKLAAAAGAAPPAAPAPAAPKGASRLRGTFQRRAQAITGPDASSWQGLWTSLASMPGWRMLPLLQACAALLAATPRAALLCLGRPVSSLLLPPPPPPPPPPLSLPQSALSDLYLGQLMPGTPAAAALAPAAAGGNHGSSAAAPQARTQQGLAVPGAAGPALAQQQQDQQALQALAQQQPQPQPPPPLQQQPQQPASDHAAASSLAGDAAAGDAAGSDAAAGGPAASCAPLKAGANPAAAAAAAATSAAAPEHDDDVSPRKEEPGGRSARPGHARSSSASTVPSASSAAAASPVPRRSFPGAFLGLGLSKFSSGGGSHAGSGGGRRSRSKAAAAAEDGDAEADAGEQPAQQQQAGPVPAPATPTAPHSPARSAAPHPWPQPPCATTRLRAGALDAVAPRGGCAGADADEPSALGAAAPRRAPSPAIGA